MPVQLRTWTNVENNFDKVTDVIKKNSKNATAKLAGQTRKKAIKSIKKKRGEKAKENPSKPGKPPHSILDKKAGGHRIPSFLLYAKSKSTDRFSEYVVGPMRLDRLKQALPTPAVHEHGGPRTIWYYPGITHKKRQRAVRYREVSEERKHYLYGRINKEKRSGKPAKVWNDKKYGTRKRRRKMTDEQKENFWVKVVAGKIIINRGEQSMQKIKKRVIFPKRPFMTPALADVMPSSKNVFRNLLQYH